jgi:hypothetical protein
MGHVHRFYQGFTLTRYIVSPMSVTLLLGYTKVKPAIV